MTAEVEGGSGPFIYFSLGCGLQSACMKLNVQRKNDSRTLGGNFACVRLQAATSNYSNHLFNPLIIIFS